MQFAYSLSGRPALLADLTCGATLTAGEGVMRDTNIYGQCIPVTVSSATDAMGATLEAATYDATPSVSESNAESGGIAQVAIDPLAVFEANISGAATASTALSGVSHNYDYQKTASATVFTFTTSTTFTTDWDGGTMVCATGANKGLKRIITSDIDSTSRTVTVAFPNSIAVGDYVIMVPFSTYTIFGYFTTNFKELDGYTSDKSGAACRFVDVIVDIDNISAKGQFIFSDHWLNPESA